jgi:hypothetical protein
MSKKRIILMLMSAALMVVMMAVGVIPAEAKQKTPKKLPPKQAQACYDACTANGGATDASSEAFCAASCL